MQSAGNFGRIEYRGRNKRRRSKCCSNTYDYTLSCSLIWCPRWRHTPLELKLHPAESRKTYSVPSLFYSNSVPTYLCGAHTQKRKRKCIHILRVNNIDCFRQKKENHLNRMMMTPARRHHHQHSRPFPQFKQFTLFTASFYFSFLSFWLLFNVHMIPLSHFFSVPLRARHTWGAPVPSVYVD